MDKDAPPVVLRATDLTRRYGGLVVVKAGGAGRASVWFEMAGIVVLTAVYFALGIWLFRRRHMRAG
jgi:hypothetical protein